jgi:hypothetical protein
MAREDQLPWKQIADVTAAAQAFLDPILAHLANATWNPSLYQWVASSQERTGV